MIDPLKGRLPVRILAVGAQLALVVIASGPQVSAQLQFTQQALPASNLTYGPWTLSFVVGDFDGDGFRDVVIGQDSQPFDTFRVFWGPGHSPPWSLVTFSMGGVGPADAADIDGDGYDDLIAGGGGADTLGIDSGVILVRYGPSLAAETVHAFMLPGGSIHFGSLGIAADFDGNGLPDVLSLVREGTPLVWGPPHLVVLSAPALTPTAVLDLPPWTAAVEAHSWPAVGDFSGDGLPDILWSANPIPGPTGVVFGYPGPNFSTASAVPLVFPLPDPATISSLVARDWTGDGVLDVMIGQTTGGPLAPVCPTGSVWGLPGPWLSPAVSLFGSWPYAYGKGFAIAGGDVNGDGFEDMAISALSFCGAGGGGGGYPTGTVRIAYGPEFGVTQDFPGPSAGATMGVKLAIEDLDSDGFGEVIASAGGDAVVIVFRPKPLSVSATTVSLGAGGTATFAVQASAGHAGRAYVLVGSGMGASLGTWVGGIHVPLVADAWTSLFLGLLNSPVLPGSAGTLDANGEAQPALVVPPGVFAHPALIGQDLRFAVMLLEAWGGSLRAATNPVTVTLVP